MGTPFKFTTEERQTAMGRFLIALERFEQNTNANAQEGVPRCLGCQQRPVLRPCAVDQLFAADPRVAGFAWETAGWAQVLQDKTPTWICPTCMGRITAPAEPPAAAAASARDPMQEFGCDAPR